MKPAPRPLRRPGHQAGPGAAARRQLDRQRRARPGRAARRAHRPAATCAAASGSTGARAGGSASAPGRASSSSTCPARPSTGSSSTRPASSSGASTGEGRRDEFVRRGPKVSYCLRDLELTHPRLPRSPRGPRLPGLQHQPRRSAAHARHLGGLVGRLPARLPRAVDRRDRPARLLRLRAHGRSAQPPLRVERGQQRRAGDRPAAVPLGPSALSGREPHRRRARRVATSKVAAPQSRTEDGR